MKNEKSKILLGNEAIVEGALEAGVNFVATYPGTPASEIGDIFHKIAEKSGVYFEFSTNEKVALEAAAGAAFSGLRSMVAMKSFGLNVASDSLFPLLYSGIAGSMVVVVADDPQCWSSAQSEQDSRYYTKMIHIPMLEPSCPSECGDFIKSAFELSNKFKIPVMVRTTTRVAHQSGSVKISNPSPAKILSRQNLGGQAKFPIGIHRFSTMPPRVLEQHGILLENIEKIKKISEKSPANFELKGNGRFGVITSGVSYNYVIDASREFNLKLPILKIGFTYPLPEKKIENFIRKLDKVLVVEELEPFLEQGIMAIAQNVNRKINILGKNFVPKIGELKTEDIILAIAKILNKKSRIDYKEHARQFNAINKIHRSPKLCPGCPYHTIFGAVKKAAPDAIIGGDIGCHMLAIHPPYQLQDWLVSMGASIGIGHGVASALRSQISNPSPAKILLRQNLGGQESQKNPESQIRNSKQKVISFIGDSTFFHAGIPALINCVSNNSNPLIIILDNSTTAMTGHQPHPGMRGIKIENIVSACGVQNMKIVNSFNFQEVEAAVKEFLPKDEVSVIIARGECKLIKK